MELLNKGWRRYNYLQSEIGMIYHEAAVKLGLSDSAQLILYTICTTEKMCSQMDICRESGLSRQTVNSSVRKLEQEGIVYLQQGKGKQMQVCLTEKGKQVVEEKIRPLIRIENEILEDWSAEETELYLALTQRFRDGLKEKIKTL